MEILTKQTQNFTYEVEEGRFKRVFTITANNGKYAINTKHFIDSDIMLRALSKVKLKVEGLKDEI